MPACTSATTKINFLGDSMSDAPGRRLQRTVPLALLFAIGFAQAALAQNNSPLNFGNNFFVTGDYVVAGVGLRGLGANGFATQQFKMPDANSVPATGVP